MCYKCVQGLRYRATYLFCFSLVLVDKELFLTIITTLLLGVNKYMNNGLVKIDLIKKCIDALVIRSLYEIDHSFLYNRRQD